MGKFNDIQETQMQSYGSNSFTTTVKDNTVEFDSAKDSFTFLDEVNVPSLKINGQTIDPTPAQQVQSDWNQNDSEASDFVKNRTHYTESEYETLYNDTLENPTAIGIVYTFISESDFLFEEGKTYKVTVDGNEYEIEATISGEVPYPVLIYGDMTPDNPVSGSFYIVSANSMLISNFASDTEITTVDLKIEGQSEEVHQLDEKFIPASIARTSDIKSVSYTSSTSGFTQTIGTLSVGTTNYAVKMPLVNYVTWGGVDTVALEANKFTICNLENQPTSISVTSAGLTNVVNYMYAIFKAGANFQMPAGYSNLAALEEGKVYFLQAIGDSIKGWNWLFEEMTEIVPL